MGRYISGDIESKFWFGVQPSNAASQFGGELKEPYCIEYYYSDIEEFELDHLEELIKKANTNYNKHFNLKTNPDDLNGIAADVLLADIQLGLLIYQHLLEHGEICFKAEL